MLKIMENEKEIFIAWLKKYIKKDKKITGKELARRIGVSPPTITSYLKGRTKPDFEKRNAILAATNKSYKEILIIGRQELYAEDGINLEKMTDHLEAKYPILRMQGVTNEDDIKSYKKKKNASHHEIVDQFTDKELAEKINRLLLKLERTNKKKLEVVLKWLELELEDAKEDEEGGLKKETGE